MFIDNQLYMSNAQSFAGVTGATASTSYIDMTVAGNAGQPLWVIIRVETTFATAGGNPTLDVALQCDSDTAFGSATTLWSVSSIAEATLVDEYTIYKAPLPDGCERNLRVLYTPSSAYDSGKIDAFLTMNPDRV